MWTGEDEFYPANRDNLDTFGWDVALEGDTVFVGAPLHDIGTVTDTGSVYLFTRESDETWTEQLAITADDADSNDQFGLSVAMDSGNYLVGAPVDDEVGSDGGAAYWFQPAENTTITYTYDPLYRVTNAVYTGTVAAEFDYYLYDAVGNMTVYTETITTTQVTTRTVNERNQLVLTNQGGVTTTMHYDANGNLTAIRPAGVVTTGAKIYGYDQRNLMVTATQYVTNSYEAVAEYRYDGNRTRLQQLTFAGGSTTTITYTQDLMNLAQVLVADNGISQTHYLMGHTRLLQDNDSERRHLLSDGLGTPRVEMVGSTIDTISTYEPYGSLLAQTGSSGTVYGFAGEEYDTGTGLTYLRARYYSADLMQFFGRDAYAGQPRIPATMHGYSYAHGNPVLLTDPSGNCVGALGGLDTLFCATAIGATAGAVIGGGTEWAGQIRDNLNNDMALLDAMYYKNLNWDDIGRATAVGGVAGAASGALAPFAPVGTAGGAISYGALDGAVSGFAEQLFLNATDPCRKWNEGLGTTTAASMVAGGLTGGMLDSIGGSIARGARNSGRNWMYMPNSLRNRWRDMQFHARGLLGRQAQINYVQRTSRVGLNSRRLGGRYYYNPELNPGVYGRVDSNTPNTNVGIGYDAFESRAILESTLGHEAQHIQQYNTPNYKSTQYNAQSVREFDAYFWEIDNAHLTGLPDAQITYAQTQVVLNARKVDELYGEMGGLYDITPGYLNQSYGRLQQASEWSQALGFTGTLKEFQPYHMFK